MQGRGDDLVLEYQVPAGKRLVVRFLSAVAFTVSGQGLFCFLNGVTVLYWPAPGPNARLTEEVRWVAYAGDYVATQTFGSDVSFHMSGFLFADEPAAAAREPAPPAPPYPYPGVPADPPYE